MQTNWSHLIAPGLIDSHLKLRLLLVFVRHPQLRGTAAGLRQRLPGDPWALEDALEALADAGLLERARTPGAYEYTLTQRGEPLTQLAQLATCFDDPHRRDEIYALVRAADQERRFRDASSDRYRVSSGDHYDPVVV